MKQQFIVKVESIPSTGLQLKDEWDIRTIGEILQQDIDLFKSCSPLSLNLSFSLLGEKIIIEGSFRTTIIINCVSCLSEYKQSLEADFRYILWPQSTTPAEAEQELQQEDMEMPTIYPWMLSIRPTYWKIRLKIYRQMVRSLQYLWGSLLLRAIS